MLADNVSDDVLVWVEEEYGIERHNLSGLGPQTRLIKQTCAIGGLKIGR